MENISNVIPQFEGLKTRITYDFSTVLGKLLFQKILPYYLKEKRIFYTIYTELKCKKLYKLMKLVGIDDSQFRGINVIKIGKTESVPFGKLHKIIPETEDIDAIFRKLQSIFKDVTEKDVIILCGFDILVALKGQSVLNKLKDLYESLPDCTLFFTSRENLYDNVLDKLLVEFHENNLSLKQQEFSDSYTLEFEDSILVMSSYRII